MGQARQVRTRGRAEQARRLGLDRLERRDVPAALLPDIALLAASTADSHAVQIQFETRNLAAAQPFEVDVALVRSADDRYDPTEDVRVAEAVVTFLGDGSGSFAIEVPGGLGPNPSRPFVLAVADPDGLVLESDESDNVAGFRKYLIGVVTHGGIQDGSKPPAWSLILADELRAIGYDAVINYVWAAESRTPGAAAKQGPRLANVLLTTSQLFPFDAPVDLHLIGHSQGTVVNSQALLTLERVSTPQIQAGYIRDTMLDPHAANNGAPGQFSVEQGFKGWFTGLATSTYQWLAADPMVIVPDNVDEAQVYYQHTPVTLDGNDWSSNLYGQAPVIGEARYSDLTGPGIAHSGVTGVQTWYFLNVVPTLADGGTFVNPTAMTGRLQSSNGDRTSGEVTLTADATPTFDGTAVPGGTVRLFVQPSPGADFTLVDETNAGPDGSWTLDPGDLSRGQYRFVARGIVPAGAGPWTNFYPLLPLGRLAVRPDLGPVLRDHLGSAEPPALRDSTLGPRGLPAPIPDALGAHASRPPRPFELSPRRERLLSRFAEQILDDRTAS